MRAALHRSTGPGSTQPRSTGRGRSLPALLLALAAACGGAAGGERPRNLLLCVLDTTRADHLSCYGRAGATSPTVDALARSGARFEAAWAQSSLTPVSAGAFLTGALPPRHGVRSLFTVAEERLSADVTTLAEVLGGAGLATAGFVSAVPMSARYGLDRGFAEYHDRFGHREATPCGNEYQRRADETTDLALAWLSQEGVDPFFLLVHFFDAHDASLAPPREFLEGRVSFPLPKGVERPCALSGLDDAGKVELYDAEIAWMDAQLARLLERLERLGVRDETLVVVLADHGEGLGDHGVWTHGWLWREQLRVPLVMAGPGVPAGAVVADDVRLVDLVPSLCELFDVPPPAALDGASFVPLLRGERVPPRELYAEVRHAVEDRLEREVAMAALAEGRWKYVERTDRAGARRSELYDLDEDPGERRDLFRSDHPEAARLRARLAELGAFGGRVYSAEGLPPEDLAPLNGLGYLGSEPPPREGR